MTPHIPIRQSRGGALLSAMLLLMAFAALATSGHLASRTKLRGSEHTVAALAQARDALIGYAFSYPELNHDGQAIGYLPCPDKTNSGSVSLGACNARDHGAFGRFPYRTLGLPILRDAHGQCLWYAVAGSVKHNPKPLSLNWDSPGQFRIVSPSGHAISGEEYDVIAVILAPGTALPGQIRPPASTSAQRCPGGANASDDLPIFLDSSYVSDISGNLDIVHGEPDTGFNDIAAWITVDQLFGTLRRRSDFPTMIDTILDSAALSLQSHIANIDPDNPGSTGTEFLAAQAETIIGNRAHGRLPDSTSLGIASEQAAVHDNWRDQLRFVACTDGSTCLTVTLADSAGSPSVSMTETCRALVLFGGERLRGTQRRSTAIERADSAQYLEGLNHMSFFTGTGDYAGYRHYAVTDPHLPASEDLIRCIP